jgi:Uma2 family endonuclease
MSFDTSMVAAMLNMRLLTFVRQHDLGWLAQSDGGLQIFPDAPSKVRFADGVFIAKARAPRRPIDGHLRVVPDLVIEVVSPNDNAEDVETKISEYLGAGVKLIWVVYPETRSVHVVRPSGVGSRLTHADTLSGEDVVSGFELPIAEIFDF